MKTLIIITAFIIPVCLYTQNGNEILSEDFYLTYKLKNKLKYKFKDSESRNYYIDSSKLLNETDIKNMIQFTGDSIISVSYNFNGLQTFELGSVRSISFYEGRSVLKGALFGGIVGAVLFLAALAFEDIDIDLGNWGGWNLGWDLFFKPHSAIEQPKQKSIGATTATSGALVIGLGAGIGALIGALIKDYDEYKLNQYKDNKAKKEAILRLAKKYKPRL
jgi:hypothetical protein